MHVIYFHQYFSTPKGSTGTRSYEMAKKLIARGHKVTMVCGSCKGAETGLSSPFKKGVREGQVEGIQVVEFALNYANKDGFIKRAGKFLKFALLSMRYALKAKYDVIFATSTPLTVALPALIGHWIKRKPFIFEVRDLWPELPEAMGIITNPLILRALSTLERVTYRNAQGIIALSPGIQEGILKRGILPEKVTIIPNGSDLALFEASASPWQPPGILDQDFVAVYAGTHGLANGLDAVLNAAKILKDKEYLSIKLLLVGQGKLKPQLLEKAKTLELDNIIFLDPIEKTQLSQLFARADIGLQILANIPAFYYGTSPNKFFDYIAAGLPVLINYPGWLAEKIRATDCGLVINPEDPLAFAEGLINLSQNPEQRKIMRKAALALAIAEFDRQHLSDQFVDSFERWVF